MTDQSKMNEDYNIKMRQCIDLNHLYIFTYFVDEYFTDLSLKRIFAQVCGSKMKYKTKEIACSNWENDVLSQRQILYAADDAFSGYCIFRKLYKYHGEIKSVRDLAKHIDDFMYEYYEY